MSLALATSGRLKPDIRLAKAVSQFEADLSGDQKATFRTQRSLVLEHAPEPGDVMRLTAEIDRCASRSQGIRARCVGPRLTNVLQAIQQYVGLGDIIIGGSQSLIACGVWTLVRTSLLLITNHAAYLEKLSVLFMNAGRSAPRYQQMALLYPRSKTLQGYMCEYLLVIVQICHRMLLFSKKSYISQLATSLNDSDVKQYQTELDTWATSIKEEVNLLMGQKIEDEAKENSRFRALTNKFSETAAHRKMVKERLRTLDACSTFDHQTPWKQARKIGSTTLFLETPEYAEWRNGGSSRTFVCTGKLGSGKSVLMANMIDDLNIYTEVDKFPVAYFFCRHDIPESLRPRTVIGSLIRQILSTASDIPTLPYTVPAGQELDLDKMIIYFRENFEPQSHCYFLLDGLDECSESDRQIILTYCLHLQEHLQLVLCVSFRLEADNRLQLSLNNFASPIVWKIPDNNPEIVAYIDSELQAKILENKLSIGDPTIVLEIRDALLEGAQGMFLWVALQISSLCAEKTDQKIRDALKDLPKDLSKTFSRILERAPAQDRVYQKRILQLVTVAYRPLAVEELREALSVIPGDTDWDPAKLVNDIYSTLACCGSLITVDEEEATIRFVHHSVKQYLTGDFKDETPFTFNLEDANRTMGQIILTYLSYNVFDNQLSTTVIPEIHTGAAPKKIISSLDSSSKSRSLALKLLSLRMKGDSGSQPDYDIGQILASHSRQYQKSITHETFAFHLYSKTHWLIHTKSIPESDGFSHRTLKRLLEGLSDLPSTPWGRASLHPPSFRASPQHDNWRSQLLRMLHAPVLLYWALLNSHLPLFRHQSKTMGNIKTISWVNMCLNSLLSSANWHQDMCTQLLPFAALNRSGAVTRKLLDNGALVSNKDYCAVTAAIWSGNSHVLKLLLRDFESLSEVKWMLNDLKIDAVLVACRANHPTLVSLLVSLGADVNRFTGSTSPLFYVLQSVGVGPDFVEAVENLIDAGAELHCPVEPFVLHNLLMSYLDVAGSSSLLSSAIRNCSKDNLNRLLYDCCSSYVSSPNPRIVELASFALNHGADAGFYDTYAGRDCLSMAVFKDDEEHDPMINLLLNFGASPVTRCEAAGLNALEHCLMYNKSHTLRRCMLGGVDRTVVREAITSLGLLHRRIKTGDYGSIEFLCAYANADINAANSSIGSVLDRHGSTPLLMAIHMGCKKFDPLTLVLDIVFRGADLSYQGPTESRSPLYVIMDRVTCGHDKLCFHKESATYLRIARCFIAFGAQYDESLITWVIELSLSLFEWESPAELAGDSVHRPTPSADPPDKRRKNLHQSHPEDSILYLLEQLLRDLITRLPPSDKLKREIISQLKGAMYTRYKMYLTMENISDIPVGSPSYLFMGHIVTILEMLATSLATAPLAPSIQNPYPLIPSNSDLLQIEDLPQTEDLPDSEDLKKSMTSILANYTLPDKPLGTRNWAWMDMFSYSLLKHGRQFHEIITQNSAVLSDQDWAAIFYQGMQTAVSEGDVESVRAGCHMLRARNLPDHTNLIDEALSRLNYLNSPPEPGVCYELETNIPTMTINPPRIEEFEHVLDLTPDTALVELDSLPIDPPIDFNRYFENSEPIKGTSVHNFGEAPKKNKSRWWRPDS